MTVRLRWAGVDRPLVARECPAPVRRPVMVQRWADVVFLHWSYDPAVVQRLVPPALTVDTFGGAAWVGLVPFRMEGLGVPGLAPLPLVGSFPEINVRTYVRHGDRRGVWFFSLDVDRLLPTLAARTAYRLPYFTGAASHVRTGDVLTSSVVRRWPRRWPHRPDNGSVAEVAHTVVAVRTGGPADDGPLLRFLTSRWGLYSSAGGSALRHAPVDHEPWPLHRAEVLHLDDGLVTAAGLPRPESQPLAVWSPGVEVKVGRPRRVRPDARTGL